ncbi:MAG: thioredoxin family protein [Candidatus Hydrogenedentes bacterium]|nr:thioredoxin family protein [Candidatus Hydrogenedentota bacterium]
MVAVNSQMVPLGTIAHHFELPDPTGKIYKLSNLKGEKGTLIIFMCNHCPFVKHVIREIVNIANDYVRKGIAVVGINSNDTQKYPEDSPQNMIEFIKHEEIPFPYLIDETQEVAKLYKAACTPDFFLFDSELRLFYRGQLDSSRPGNNIPVSGEDLRNALESLLSGKSPPANQKPSMGCNIKWKPGNEPDYFKP